MQERTVYRLQLGLLALYFAASAALWPGLPERVPMHFDFAGQPTRWTGTTPLSWFGLPLCAAATTLLLYGLSRWAAHRPELFNVPERRRFLALPPAERAPIEAYLRRWYAWTSVLVTLTLVGVHIGVYETATGRSGGLSWRSLLVTWTPMVILLGGALWSTRRLAERLRGTGTAGASRREPG